MNILLTQSKSLQAADQPVIDTKLDLEFLKAANKCLQYAREFAAENPQWNGNWYEVQGRIESEVQDLRNQICKQSAYLSQVELEDLSLKVFVLSVYSKKLLTISNKLVA